MSDNPYACQCGCGLDATSTSVKSFIGRMRAHFEDLRVISGTRCDQHNRAIGGSALSGHKPIWGPDGKESVAVDVTLVNWSDGRMKFLCAEGVRQGAMGVCFNRAGRSVHFDLKPRTWWAKRENGKYVDFF